MQSFHSIQLGSLSDMVRVFNIFSSSLLKFCYFSFELEFKAIICDDSRLITIRSKIILIIISSPEKNINCIAIKWRSLLGKIF